MLFKAYVVLWAGFQKEGKERKNGMPNVFYHRCKIVCFKYPHSFLETILSISDSRIRASAHRLLRWILSQGAGTIHTSYPQIPRATGLADKTVSKVLHLLSHEQAEESAYPNVIKKNRPDRLITVQPHTGSSGGYEIELNGRPSTVFRGITLSGLKYFQVPQITESPKIKWTGLDALAYDYLLSLMNRSGKSELKLSVYAWQKALNVTKPTMFATAKTLEELKYIRLHTDTIEILDPNTGNSMPRIAADLPGEEKVYVYDETGAAKVLCAESFDDPQLCKRYYETSLNRTLNSGQNNDVFVHFTRTRFPHFQLTRITGFGSAMPAILGAGS